MELKPCPFCGGQARLEASLYVQPPLYWVKCRACEAGCTASHSRDSAEQAWNARATDRQAATAGERHAG